MDAVAEGAVGDAGFDVGGEVEEDFEGQVAEFFALLVGALDLLPGVGFGEFEAEVVADCFPEREGRVVDGVGVGCGAGECGEVRHERFQVVVVGVGFKAESVFERDGEGVDEVEGREFGEEICFSIFGVHIMAFFDVDPDMAGQVP